MTTWETGDNERKKKKKASPFQCPTTYILLLSPAPGKTGWSLAFFFFCSGICKGFGTIVECKSPRCHCPSSVGEWYFLFIIQMVRHCQLQLIAQLLSPPPSHYHCCRTSTRVVLPKRRGWATFSSQRLSTGSSSCHRMQGLCSFLWEAFTRQSSQYRAQCHHQQEWTSSFPTPQTAIQLAWIWVWHLTSHHIHVLPLPLSKCLGWLSDWTPSGSGWACSWTTPLTPSLEIAAAPRCMSTAYSHLPKV